MQIERVELTEREVVTEQVNYFFAWEGLVASSEAQVLPLPSGFMDSRSGLALPYELGWLHLDTVTENESEHPGLGVSVSYGGLGGKAGMYLYDNGQPVDLADLARVDDEFRRAVGDAVRIMDGASISGAWQVPGDRGPATWRLAILDLPDGQLSAVVLGEAQGMFVKGRVTWDGTEEVVRDMGHACVKAIMERIRPATVRAEAGVGRAI